jgi:hypothetical protein
VSPAMIPSTTASITAMAPSTVLLYIIIFWMPGGRPTDDPKTILVAARLAPRHVRLLERRACREGVSLSEALRRYLDELGAYERVGPRRRRTHQNAHRGKRRADRRRRGGQSGS